ncbi:hypothetical protein BDN72DRAFT_865442 [Pluteus cervinus]|uniref:Uncharacterized protein n=1 Tax=Pluteus cervinus TaxID=181527 RepID=A0ACD3A0E5_9AGAR|nr:hypothetical protein BDN72DRAFT_865442 [Pluteus cervinus]
MHESYLRGCISSPVGSFNGIRTKSIRQRHLRNVMDCEYTTPFPILLKSNNPTLYPTASNFKSIMMSNGGGMEHLAVVTVVRERTWSRWLIWWCPSRTSFVFDPLLHGGLAIWVILNFIIGIWRRICTPIAKGLCECQGMPVETSVMQLEGELYGDNKDINLGAVVIGVGFCNLFSSVDISRSGAITAPELASVVDIKPLVNGDGTTFNLDTVNLLRCSSVNVKATSSGWGIDVNSVQLICEGLCCHQTEIVNDKGIFS